MSNSISIPELTEYQVYVLGVAANNNRKYIIMEGTSPGDDEDKRATGERNLAEVDALVRLGFFLYADPDVYQDFREEAASRGCTCVGYLVKDFVRKMFKDYDSSKKPN